MVFDNNMAAPPKHRPDLVGSVFQALAPAAITVGLPKGSAEVGRLKVRDILKVIDAYEEGGQVRVMSTKGWVSVASRKNVKFLQATGRQLSLDKHDRRARKAVEKRARAAEAAEAAEAVAEKEAAAAERLQWADAIGGAEFRLGLQADAAAKAQPKRAREEADKVRKTPSWPRSWANSSLF